MSSSIDDLGPSQIAGLEELSKAVTEASDLPSLPLAEVRLGPPITRPGKILGIGLNYVDHAAESEMEIPKQPIVFLKAPSSFSGPFDDLLIPPGATKVDWEVELGVVIGSEARYLQNESEASAVIAGFLTAHDVSERAHQLEMSGQWTKGKSADSFAPTGPWLVTPDEVGDYSDLELRCWVNGELRQSGSTSDMIFGVDYIIYHLSQFMTLEPGDLIMTGTPPGVGLSTGTYLEPGDVVELEVSGLGRQRQVCRAADR